MVLMFWIAVILVASVLSALFSGLETGIYSFDSHKKTKLTQKLVRLLKHKDSLVIACLVGTNFAVYFATVAFNQTLGSFHINERWLHLLEMLVLTPYLFVVGEIMPKSLFQARANTLTPRFTWFLALSTVVFSPFIVILRTLTRLFAQFASEARDSVVMTRQRLQWVIEDHMSHLSREQSQMVDNILALKERHVTSIMVPCKKVSRIPSTLPIKEVKNRFLQTDYSFFVVYDKKPENVRGIVYLNKILLSDNNESLEDLIVEIPEISYKKTLTDSLNQLREKSIPIGKVTGAKGHVLGLVFTRQIVQEIVGELQIW